MVYVFDSKALHNVVIKDQYIYEETPVTLTRVPSTNRITIH